MKFFLLLGLVYLSLSASLKEEPSVLATNSISLQELLDKVKLITKRLEEESLLEINSTQDRQETQDPPPN
jgi:hypothetical protein